MKLKNLYLFAGAAALAWLLFNKKGIGAMKKSSSRKIEQHKDTKSHNVNIHITS